jgi:hypothetical protein
MKAGVALGTSPSILLLIVCLMSTGALTQKAGDKAPPVPGPMLNQGLVNYDTPEFTLSLVRSSQTVAALKPKGASTSHRETSSRSVRRMDTFIWVTLPFACAQKTRRIGRTIRQPPLACQ